MKADLPSCRGKLECRSPIPQYKLDPSEVLSTGMLVLVQV
jgi:hypothetical protein